MTLKNFADILKAGDGGYGSSYNLVGKYYPQFIEGIPGISLANFLRLFQKNALITGEEKYRGVLSRTITVLSSVGRYYANVNLTDEVVYLTKLVSTIDSAKEMALEF